MSINLQNEKALRLSAQERYDIIDFAIQAAEDNGFMNSFIFERALWLFAAIRLCEERKDEISAMISINLLEAWDVLVQDDTIRQMIDEYADEIEVLAKEALIWYEEYTDYIHSARGLLSTAQMFSGDIMKQALNQFTSMQNDGDFQNVMNIAQEWGIDNKPVAQLDQESLFVQE